MLLTSVPVISSLWSLCLLVIITLLDSWRGPQH
jgi:hypothetical protein